MKDPIKQLRKLAKEVIGKFTPQDGYGKFNIAAGPYVLTSGEEGWANRPGMDDWWIYTLQETQINALLEELRRNSDLEPGVYALEDLSGETSKRWQSQTNALEEKMVQEVNEKFKHAEPTHFKKIQEANGWNEEEMNEFKERASRGEAVYSGDDADWMSLIAFEGEEAAIDSYDDAMGEVAKKIEQEIREIEKITGIKSEIQTEKARHWMDPEAMVKYWPS